MIKELPISEKEIVAFEAQETLTEEEFKQVAETVKSRINKYENVRLMIVLPHFVFRKVTTIESRISFLKDHLGYIEKLALVGDEDQKLFDAVSKIVDMVSDTDIRRFTLSEQEKAKEWIAG
ncbi:STAS/SEC14 domain-containing protein [Thalassorhabdus alkalitolerans]|uniref:STAS/SEC14 domain-containing protein n=1 Tax=Thalassorhabdus alkalitolerans TaxID=2282697 RepID=A0ABW0YH81_9BACI